MNVRPGIDARSAVGVNGPADNHHLWRNRRTWWVAFTIVCDGHRQERIRQSLATRDVETARTLRDQVMRAYQARPGVVVSLRRPS